jgi:hypothetical protein
MNRRVCLLGLVFGGLLGCYPEQFLKPPAELTEHSKEKEPEVKTIGDVSAVANADPIPVSGVGLVVGLEGTGGSAPPGSFRTFLEHQLQAKGVEHVKEILASPETSMVLVSALIPAGCRKNDVIDVEITLPPQSKTTSLRGGFLKECELFNYDSTKHLDPKYAGGDRLLHGHPLARAEGPLLTGLGDGDEAAKERQARIWGGGRCKIERDFFLVLNNDNQRAPLVQRVAERINSTFHGSFPGGTDELAVAKTKAVVNLRVPPQYRLNLPRFLRVVRMIPLEDIPPGRNPYRSRLEEELLDPAHTVTAALRLEALGSSSIPALKRGLENDHPLVRFTAAEALAYLGSPASGDELAKLVERQPLVRAFSLTALASLDEAISHVKLRELLASPAAETRYGAFRALRALDEHDEAVQGELLNGSFWLHRVVPDAPPMVHLSSSRRAEIVLFGEEPHLVPPFSFLAGEFTLTAARDDKRCTITRASVRHGTHRRQCSLHVEDVLHNLADMGGIYPEAVDFLRQAGTYQSLTCPVAVDALPQAMSVYDLAQAGTQKSDVFKTDEEILNAREELGATPTLYDSTPGRRPPLPRSSGDQTSVPDPKTKASKLRPEAPTGG